MKTLQGFLLLLLLAGTVYAGTCGIVPIRPIPPIGCKDLRPVCVCDANGNNCRWEWVCVP
jgi:hypothetical protein